MGHRATTVSVKYKGPEQYMLCLMSNLNPAEVRRCRCLLLSLKVGGLSQKSEDIFAAKRRLYSCCTRYIYYTRILNNLISFE
jgi:hypothetical protein